MTRFDRGAAKASLRGRIIKMTRAILGAEIGEAKRTQRW
jgi:hypothetical protein